MKKKFRPFFVRTAWGSLLAFFLIFMFHFFTTESGIPTFGRNVRSYLTLLWVFVFINLLFNGLLWLDRHLDRSIPWYRFPKKRLFTEIAIAFPSTLVITLVSFGLIHHSGRGHLDSSFVSTERFIYTYIVLMIVMVVAVSIVIAANFFRNLRESILEVERLKREKMKSDYQALQSQLNPHFLFNNFNMLMSEIRRDPENAVLITERLADVYRYVLESKNHETVSFSHELEFGEAILFLHTVRFGANLEIDLRVPEAAGDFRLPPLTLQILVENALKHNVVSSAHPLSIRIAVEKDTLVVSNT
ncbi:MAG: hypothetical protein GY765_00750, partial [bacterium]|nr:hypothetical protein [bacterium]